MRLPISMHFLAFGLNVLSAWYCTICVRKMFVHSLCNISHKSDGLCNRVREMEYGHGIA